MTTRHPIGIAERAAHDLRDLLAPACERIEVAGSIRRRRPEVKDLELVAVPRIETEEAGLWGEPTEVDRLNERVASLVTDDTGLEYRRVEIHRADGSTDWQYRNGPSYKALSWQGLPVDLFVVQKPADWGVLFTIRTGPADWSQRLVTDCQRWFMRVEGGRLLHHGEHVPCPEERDFLAAIGQPWVEPSERSAERVRLGRRAQP